YATDGSVCRGGVGRWAAAGASFTTAPPAGATGADAVIADLQAQGYDVQLNWVSGFDTQQLSDCTVTGVDTPDHSGARARTGQLTLKTLTEPLVLRVLIRQDHQRDSASLASVLRLVHLTHTALAESRFILYLPKF